jgi:hypothetical protein
LGAAIAAGEAIIGGDGYAALALCYYVGNPGASGIVTAHVLRKSSIVSIRNTSLFVGAGRTRQSFPKCELHEEPRQSIRSRKNAEFCEYSL